MMKEDPEDVCDRAVETFMDSVGEGAFRLFMILVVVVTVHLATFVFQGWPYLVMFQAAAK